jgi:hypothetical protein
MQLTMYSIEDAKNVAAFVRSIRGYADNVSRKHTTVEFTHSGPLPQTLEDQRSLRLYLEANIIRTTSRCYGF